MSIPHWIKQVSRWTNATGWRGRRSNGPGVGLRNELRRRRKYRPWLEDLEGRLAPAVTLSIANATSLVEGDSGTRLAKFVVTRSGDLAPTVQVDYTTQDGTAHAGVDYVATSGTLSFAPNQTRASIFVLVLGNTIFQPDHTFTVALSNPLVVASFADPLGFATGMRPSSVVAADFNGDGLPDLAIANSASGSVSVLVNATAPGGGTPSFATQATFSVGSNPYAVTVGDFNADGRPDLAVTNLYPDNSVSVLLNTTPPGASIPSFAVQQAFATGATPDSIVVADLNGDGKPDVAVTNYNHNSGLSVLLNTTPAGATAATFAAQQFFYVGNGAFAVAAGDFNGDGRLDLAVANRYPDNGLLVLLNTTAPGASFVSFAVPQVFAAASYPASLAVADLNGDARPDLVVANGSTNTVWVLLNTTAPGASSASFAEPQTFAIGSQPMALAVADFNSDGKLDLAVTYGTGLSMLPNTTPIGADEVAFADQQLFTTDPATYKTAAVADFNLDGKPDIAGAFFYGNTVSVLLNTTSGDSGAIGFGPQQAFLAGRGTDSVAVADFNSDGKPDIATANSSDNTVSVLLNTTATGAGIPNFARQQTFATGSSPNSVVAGDLNGDGRPDVIVASPVENTVSLLLNTTSPGDTTVHFADQQTFATGIDPTSVALGDFNNDGKPDLAIANFGSNTVSVFLNTTPAGAGSLSFAPMQSFAAGYEPYYLAVADFNDDGKPDVVVSNANSRTITVLLNATAPGASTASLAAPQTLFVDTLPQSVAVGDFNGDSKPDIVYLNMDSNGFSVLLNTTAPGAGTVSFAAPQSFAGGTNPRGVTVADFNGDGIPDLAIGVSIFLNKTAAGASTPNFASPSQFGSTYPASLAIGDFNSDGKADVVTADIDFNAVSVLLNTCVPSTFTIVRGTASCTIRDDDAPVSISIVAGNNQSATVNTPFATNMAVAVQNAAGHLVQGVTVTFVAPASGPTGTFGSGISATAISDASGRATAPFFSANRLSGTYLVSAQASGGGSPSTNFTMTNTAGVGANHFGVTISSTIPTAGLAFNVTVSALDISNNVVTNYVGTIRFTGSDANGTLPTDYTFLPGDNGVHTFVNGVTFRTAGGQILTVTDAAIPAITGSSMVSVIPAAADHLVFIRQPTNTVAGQAITPSVEVELLDRFGNLTSSTASVSIVLQNNYSGGTLSGTLTRMATAGVATFDDLWIDKTGWYTLQVDSTGVTGAMSNQFNIAPAAADHLSFRQQPTTIVVGDPITPAIQVEIVDRFGNLTPSTADVSMSIGANPGGGTLTGTTLQTASFGIATFAGLSITMPGTGYTLTARSTGVTAATSDPFNVLQTNNPPVLDPIPDMGVSLGKSLTFTAHATDPDSPPQNLTFSLDPGAPANAHIDPVTGVFTLSSAKFGIYTITIRVTDNGIPPLSASRTFHVFVAPQVKTITLNDGTSKNPTVVTFLTVSFNSRVNIDSGAFELARLGSGGGPVGVTVASVNVINGKTVATLRFSGSFVLPGGVLMSGQYSLTTHGSLIHDAVTGLALDGDNNGLPGGDSLFTFSVP
jgi:hypothetical protein